MQLNLGSQTIKKRPDFTRFFTQMTYFSIAIKTWEYNKIQALNDLIRYNRPEMLGRFKIDTAGLYCILVEFVPIVRVYCFLTHLCCSPSSAPSAHLQDVMVHDHLRVWLHGKPFHL